MSLNVKFWSQAAIFQVVFGLTVFFVTRSCYLKAGAATSAGAAGLPPAAQWKAPSQPSAPSPIANAPATTGSATAEHPGPAITDPAEVLRQADDYFAKQDYTRAAALYEQLVRSDAQDASAYNNLGITLHYLGRSAEAVNVLETGISLDPTFARIWLTKGFVNLQLGNPVEARLALTKAAELGANTDVGKSASDMLRSIPPM